MAEMVKMKVKTPCCGEFYWVKGIVEEEGVYNELSKENERSLTVRYHKDSNQAKQLIQTVENLWKEFKEANPKVKQKEPDSTPIKPVLDENGDETDMIEVKFKTRATWPDGKTKIVKVFNAKGQDVTEQFMEKGIMIGNGTLGVVHGVFSTYEYLKKFGITSYLTAIQIAKLVEYSDGVEPDDLTAEIGEEEAFVASEGNEAPVESPEI